MDRKPASVPPLPLTDELEHWGVHMGLKADSAAMHDLAARGAAAQQVASGFTFTEGPIWFADGSYLLFSDMPGDVRRRYDPGEGVREVMRPSNKGNGMTIDNDGNLIVCEHSTSSVVRERPDGTREAAATHYQGQELNSPNDVVVKSDGSIYFSDPTFGRMPGFGVEREQELDFQGVFRVPPGGGEVELVMGDFEQPNGLCFSPDESLLYINDTPRAHIRVFDVQPDGSVTNDRVFADGIGDGVIEKGVVDGMKIDEHGNVYVTGPGGVWVFDARGNRLGVIELPENCANLNWAEDGWQTLYFTASTSLYRLEMLVAGNRLGYMR